MNRPPSPARILVLGGSAEGRLLAEAMARAGRDGIVSLAGAVRKPGAQALPMRIGGWGGAAAQAAWMAAEGIGAVVDATHPFAARIGARTAAICSEAGLPCLRLLRPGWREGPGDRWLRVASAGEVAAVVPETEAVFLATGRQSLEELAGLAGRRLWLRVVDPPAAPFPWPNGDWLVGRPPFEVAGELALFRRLGIGWLVAKDAGGAGGWAKMAAARELGLPVALIGRPAAPEGVPVVTEVAGAVDWVARL